MGFRNNITFNYLGCLFFSLVIAYQVTAENISFHGSVDHRKWKHNTCIYYQCHVES
jgi:hypothetical protein